MPVTFARYPTAHASRYLQQLCKHFAHKVAVDYDAQRGQCALPSGQAEFAADAEGLGVTIRSDTAKEMIQARYVIDSHLVIFAHRDGFTGLRWQMADEA